MTQYPDRGTFTQIPNILLDSYDDLPETALIGFIRLARLYGHKGIFAGSIRKLSKAIRMSKSTTARIIPSWEKAGLVSKSSHPKADEERDEMILTIHLVELWEKNTTYCNQCPKLGHSIQTEATSVPIWDKTVPDRDDFVPEWDTDVPNWDGIVPLASTNHARNTSNTITNTKETLLGDCTSVSSPQDEFPIGNAIPTIPTQGEADDRYPDLRSSDTHRNSDSNGTLSVDTEKDEQEGLGSFPESMTTGNDLEDDTDLTEKRPVVLLPPQERNTRHVSDNHAPDSDVLPGRIPRSAHDGTSQSEQGRAGVHPCLPCDAGSTSTQGVAHGHTPLQAGQEVAQVQVDTSQQEPSTAPLPLVVTASGNGYHGDASAQAVPSGDNVLALSVAASPPDAAGLLAASVAPQTRPPMAATPAPSHAALTGTGSARDQQGVGNRPSWVKPAPTQKPVTQTSLEEVKPPTRRQIEQQRKQRTEEIWVIVERELKTKYSKSQRKYENNTEGMGNLLDDEVSDTDLTTALKGLTPFWIGQFNLKKFHELMPGLLAAHNITQNGNSKAAQNGNGKGYLTPVPKPALDVPTFTASDYDRLRSMPV